MLHSCTGAACFTDGVVARDALELDLAMHLFGEGCDDRVGEAGCQRAMLQRQDGAANNGAWHRDLRRGCSPSPWVAWTPPANWRGSRGWS